MKAFIVLADGFEEIEAVSVIDILKRANIKIIKAGVGSYTIKGDHGILIKTEKTLKEINPDDYNAIILPGGSKGVENLKESEILLKIIKRYDSQNKLVCAICAAPLVLEKSGVLEKRNATIYPSLKSKIPIFRNKKVVQDGNIITSKGPATAISFSLRITENLTNKKTADKVKKRLLA